VYWNNTVYFTGTASPMYAYTLSNGVLVVPPAVQSSKVEGGHHAIITANGNSNAILWFRSGNSLRAADAVTLKILYHTNQTSRDYLPLLAHFATPIAADGKIFIGTTTSLVVYGLLAAPSARGQNGLSSTVAQDGHSGVKRADDSDEASSGCCRR